MVEVNGVVGETKSGVFYTSSVDLTTARHKKRPKYDLGYNFIKVYGTNCIRFSAYYLHCDAGLDVV